MDCPDVSVLSAHHDGVLPEEASNPLRLHLGSCPSCAARLEALRRLDAEVAGAAPEGLPRPLALLPRRSRFLPWAAAAAAALLAVAVWRPRPAVPPPAPPPPADSRYRFLPPGTSIRLSADARMEGLDILSGSAQVSTDSGPVTVRIPAGKIRLESGLLSIEPESFETAFLLRDALAGEPSWNVSVLEGEAILLPSCRLKAGNSARWAPGLPPEVLPTPPDETLRIRKAWEAVPESGWHTGEPPSGSYVLEARLTPESMPPEGDAGVAYRVGNQRAVWWLRGGMTRSALGLDPLSGEVRLRIVVAREVTVFVDGKPCGRIPLDAVNGEAVGTGAIRTARGKVRVDALRWRPLE